MNKIYDIESDQLKCSFCTNYFKCSLHFANLQRYSLKACPRCLNNFTYSILHPTTYQLYRIFLLDIGLSLPLPHSLTEGADVELRQAKEEASSRISLQFEQKINTLMKEMNKIKDNLQNAFLKIEKEYADVFQSVSPPASGRLAEARAAIARLQESDDAAQKKGKEDSSRKDQLRSIRKRSGDRLEKENMQSSNYSNASKLLKSKICGGSSSRLLTHSNHSKSKELSKSRFDKSIIKTIRLDHSVQLLPRFEEDERSEVAKLLQQKTAFQSYMPKEVIKQSDACLKSESSRNLVESVLEMKSRTVRTQEIIELIGMDAAKTNFPCFLKTLKQFRQAKTVRMIRCSLVDADFDHLLHFLADSPEAETLIVTNNRLTELAVQALFAFKDRHPQSRLTNVYIGNNFISRSAVMRREGISSLSIHL